MRNRYFERIDDLVYGLSDNGVPCDVENLYDGYKVTFPWCCGEVIAHSHMLSGDKCEYAVESMWFPWDKGNVTLLDVQEAIDLITDFYKA